MGEPPDWASLAEPLLRPKVAGHGLPADSPRGNTPLPQPQDTVEAMDSRSWKTHFRAAFEAYSEALLRQGWEPLRRSWWRDWWHIYPQGWNLDDFNAELVRHGCERYSSTSASSAQIYLLVELKCDRIDAAQRKMKERVDSGGSGPTLGPESAPFRLLCCLRGHRRLTEACGRAGRQRWGGRRAWRQADDRLGPSTGAKQEADPELHGTMPASIRLTALRHKMASATDGRNRPVLYTICGWPGTGAKL